MKYVLAILMALLDLSPIFPYYLSCGQQNSVVC